MLAILLLAASAAAPRTISCDGFVECEGNATAATKRCPGQPECSGHGHCQRLNSPTAEPNCRCTEGFFGRDCSRRQRDCTKLRSCADCQHTANTKYCGWCADSRYCMPKHIHKSLAHKGKACSAWYDSTCPRNTSTSHGVDDLGYSILEEWGDDNSVALAEALVAIIDGAGGEGTSSTLGSFLMVATLGLVALCTLRERRAQERRKRFEAFMATEEVETLGLGSPTPWTSPQCRKLGPAWTEATGMRETAFADALGTSAPPHASSIRSPTAAAAQPSPQSPGLQAATDVLVGMPPAAPEDDELLRQEVRDAARRDIEERKERRRAAAEEARHEALRAERAEAEERARAQLQAKAQGLQLPATAPAASPSPASAATLFERAAQPPPISTPTASLATTTTDAAATASAVWSPPPPATALSPPSTTPAPPQTSPAASTVASASLAQAEAEFLDALDDL